MLIKPIEQWEGYEIVDSQIQLKKWLSINHIPSDPRLSVCGNCSGNCHRCSCGKQDLICTLLCKCSSTKCQNRNSVGLSSLDRKYLIDFFFLI